MDQVPVTLTEPLFDILIAVGGPTAVAINTVDLGCARQVFTQHGGVTNGNGIPNDQHPWQGRVIARVGKRVNQRVVTVSSALFLFCLLWFVRLDLRFCLGFDFLGSRRRCGADRNSLRIDRRPRFQIGGDVCDVLIGEAELAGGHHQ